MRTTYFDTNRYSKADIATPEVQKSQRTTTNAWEKFVERGHANEEIEKAVRSEILESWARCTDSGICALAVATPEKVDKDDVFVLRRKNRSL